MADQVVSSVSVDFNAKDGVTGTINRMRGQFKHLRKDIDGTSAKFKQFGSSAMAVGKQMSMKMTLPLVAAGGAAFKMASDFESSMTKIQSLVGRSAEEVEGLTKSVLSLSGKTARAPQELADAMFFITSAGIEGADAASVLEASAKAAAVGLGETATIADLATSAMNAYGKENLSASGATDVMVAAVREGKLEASELAGSMGRVLPVASAMGVSFNEVGAAFAALSRTGTNAAEAATQVRGIMTSLLKPTQQAEEALAGMGLSSEGLRKQIADEGLLSTLQTLATEFDGNAAASASVFGNVRALSGVMDLMGKNVEGTEAIFASMNDTLGATDKAFAVTSETAEFKMNQAISDFKVAMIAVGQEIIPVVLPMIQALAEWIGKIVRVFGDLPGPIKTGIVIIGGLAAALGPLIIAAGAVASAIGTLKIALAGMLGPIGLAIGALSLITVAIMKFTAVDKEAKSRQEELNAELKAAGDPTALLAERTAGLTAEYERLAGAVEQTDEAVNTFNGSNVLLQELIAGDVLTAFEDLNVDMTAVNESVKTGTDEYQRLAGNAKRLKDDEEALARILVDVDDETRAVTGSMARQLRQGELTTDQVYDMLIALDETADAWDDNNKVIEENAKKTLLNGDNQVKYAKIIGGPLLESIIRNAKANDDWTGAQDSLNAAIAQSNADLELAQRLNHVAGAAEAVGTEVEETEQKVAASVRRINALTIEMEFAVDLEGLQEQLDVGAMMLADAGSIAGAGDSMGLVERSLEMQALIQKRMWEMQQEKLKKEHEKRQREAAKKFADFVKSNLGLGDVALSRQFAESIVGSPDQIKEAFGKLFDQAFDTGLTNMPELRGALEKALEGQNQLISMAEARVTLTDSLTTAEDRLAQAIQRQGAAQTKVNNLMDQRQSMAAKTASAFGFTFGENIGAKAQAARLLEQYTAFEGNLRALRDKGFPVDIIAQVIGLGAFAGNEAAEGLLSMSDMDFTEFLTSLAGIRGIGAAIGNLQAGMMFDASIAGANTDLLGATASVEGERASVADLKIQIRDQNMKMGELAKALRVDFGTGIKDFVSTLGPLPEELARLFEIFVADLGAVITGQSKGISALGTAATGTIPGLIGNFMKGAAPSFAGIYGGGSGGGGGGGGATPGSRSNPIAVAPVDVGKLSPWGAADAGSLGLSTVNSLARREMNTKGAGFAFADAGSMGLGLGRVGQSTSVDALPGGVVINVQGSVVTERELLETIRQGALEQQRSGKAWTVDVL